MTVSASDRAASGRPERTSATEHPNPNIDFYVLAFTPERGRRKAPMLQWVIRHQAKLITLFACLQIVCLHVQTVDYLKRWWPRRPLECALEAAALGGHTLLYIGLTVFALGPLGALASSVVHGP